MIIFKRIRLITPLVCENNRFPIRFIRDARELLTQYPGFFLNDPDFKKFLKMNGQKNEYKSMKRAFIGKMNKKIGEPVLTVTNLNSIGVYRSIFQSFIYASPQQLTVNVFFWC